MGKAFKICVRVGIFLIVFMLIFSYLSAVFSPKWKNIDNTRPGIETFYAQPPDSIDVLFLGTSSFRNGFSPMTIWEQTGITSYLRATAGQIPLVSYYYLLEALEHQHPKVIVLEGSSLFSNSDVDKNESAIRKSIDPLRFSAVKWMMIRDIAAQSEDQTSISYILPLLRYHERWQELTRVDFEYNQLDTYDPFRGQYLTRGQKSLPEYRGLDRTADEAEPYDLVSLDYYLRIVRECETQGIDVILVTLPRMEKFTYAEHLGIQQFADQYGLRYIDYNMPELIAALNILPESDYQNSTHLNVFGSQKISLDFSEILKTYDFSDKRADPAYQKWNEDLGVFNQDINS